MSETDDQAKWIAAQWHRKMLVDRCHPRPASVHPLHPGCTVGGTRQEPRRAGPAWAGWGQYSRPW